MAAKGEWTLRKLKGKWTLYYRGVLVTVIQTEEDVNHLFDLLVKVTDSIELKS